MAPTSVSVLGCGWLGLPLAKHLVTQGFIVKGSTTSPDKLPVLKDAKIKPFLIICGPPLVGENIPEFFDARTLFLNVPFRRDMEPSVYKKQIDAIVDRLRGSCIEFVVFASSTAVYPRTLKEAREGVRFTPDNPRSRTLYEIERSLLEERRFQTTLIRFAGLYGGSRRIGDFLTGPKRLSRSNGPANLIHLEDCVGIVHEVIQKDARGEIFNACSDVHPYKEELYTKAAKNMGLAAPSFNEESSVSSKVVINEKIKKELGYRFKHPDPLDDC